MLENLFKKENWAMGVVFLLVNFSSIVVVATVCGFNIPIAFLTCGINTVLFHAITKNKLSSFVGTSGLFIGGILIISSKYGEQYAVGGVMMAGVIYTVMAFVFLKWQDEIMKHIPKWLLSMALLLIGLGLIPIGSDIIKTNLAIGLISLLVMFIIENKCSAKVRLFSMPIAIAVASIVNFSIEGLPVLEKQVMEITTPMFNVESFFVISIIAIATLFEIMSDCKLAGDIKGIDIFEEVGMFRVLLASGIGCFVSGTVGGGVATTFSENNQAVVLTGYKNGYAQVVTGILFVILAFVTPVSSLLMCIPQEAFGGVLIYLFASICISSIKQLSDAQVLDTKKPSMIMAIMLAIFFMNFTVLGIGISSIAVSVLVGIVLNLIIKDN